MTGTAGTKLVRSRHLLGRVLALLVVLGAALFAAQGPPRHAGAAFHFEVIDEVMFGYGGDPDIQYVEIKMLSAGQNITAHSILGYFNTNGTYGGDILEVPSNVVTGTANGRWIMATAAFAAAAGITPDFTFTPVALPAAGMICHGGGGGVFPLNPPTWTRTTMTNWVDCVPYGGYVGPPIKNGPATPFGLGDGSSSLTRLTDTDNTSVDFALACPSPTANTAAVGFDHDNHFDLPPTRPFDDLTDPNSDLVGDGCGDTDDDGDDLPDADETFPSPGCPSATAAPDPLDEDSDDDNYLDGIECTLGFDPRSAASKPLFADTCGGGVVDDGDKITARLEACFYNTDPTNADTDGDMAAAGARDGCEIASFNNDRIVNVADQGIIASVSGVTDTAEKKHFDMNKDGTINPADRGIVASLRAAGLCP